MNQKYERIEFMIDNYPFSMDGSFTNDFISGIVVACFILEIQSTINSIFLDGQEVDPEKLFELFYENIIIDEVQNIQDIKKYYNLEKEFGIWIQIQMPTLIGYNDPDFLMSMIMIIDYFNQDFRDYIYGKPFNYDSRKNMIEYNIQNYDLKSIYDFDHQASLQNSLNLLPDDGVDINFMKSVFEENLGNEPDELNDPTYLSYGQTYG